LCDDRTRAQDIKLIGEEDFTFDADVPVPAPVVSASTAAASPVRVCA
jgi:hypothetical protein